MSLTSLPAFQQAMYTALTSSSGLTALVGSAIYDAVPQSPAFPHVILGDNDESPNLYFGQDGHDLLALVLVRTRDGSTDAAGVGSEGFGAGQAIVAEVVAALRGSVLTIVGYDLVDVEVDSVSAIREPDGITRTHEVRFRATVEEQ